MNKRFHEINSCIFASSPGFPTNMKPSYLNAADYLPPDMRSSIWCWLHCTTSIIYLEFFPSISHDYNTQFLLNQKSGPLLLVPFNISQIWSFVHTLQFSRFWRSWEQCCCWMKPMLAPAKTKTMMIMMIICTTKCSIPHPTRTQSIPIPSNR